MQMSVRRSPAIVLMSLLPLACGASSSGPPASGAPETITGSERFGWTQPAADAGELATFRYAIYVDEARSEAAEVACAPDDVSGRFACTSSLPAMTAGGHALQIAAFVLDAGIVRESARSAAVRVTKQ
jgi:hypothetical protein